MLIMKPSVLLKANRNRSHLVAVQRQITRKGKTFMQTYYVNPQDIKKKAKKKSEKILESMSKVKSQYANRPEGGFWISSFHGDKKENYAIKVPESVISHKFDMWGHTFVVHKELLFEDDKWGYKWISSEINSGLNIGADTKGDTPEEAEQYVISKLERIGKDSTDKVINKLSSIADNEKITDGSNWGIVERLTDEYADAKFIELHQLQALAAVPIAAMRKVLLRSSVDTEEDLDKEIQKVMYDYERAKDVNRIFQIGAIHDLDWDESKEHLEGLADIVDRMEEETGAAIDSERVDQWANEVDLYLQDFNVYEYQLEGSANNEMNVDQVLLYAYQHGMHPRKAKELLDDEFKTDKEEKISEEKYEANYMFLPKSEREQLLSDNTESNSAFLGGGINKTYRVTLSNGHDIDGVWKPAYGESPARSYIPIGTYYIREALAWEIDKGLQLGLVPPTIIKSIDDEMGSVQEFRTDAYMSGEKKLDKSDLAVMQEASLFDFLVFNTDRHGGNYMIDGQGGPILIDNGLIMPINESQHGNQFYMSDFYTSGKILPSVMNKLKEANWENMVNWMYDNGIEHEAIDLFVKRAAWLFHTGELPAYSDVRENLWSKMSTDPSKIKEVAA